VRNYFIFLKKELIEAFKTYNLLIMGAVFLIFGIMSPLMAKMMPEILRWAVEADPSTAGMDLSVLFTEPKALDAWAQFYSNAGFMGLIVLVVVFSGMLSSEFSKGTLTIILTKGLSRSAAILSKLTSAIVIWTASYAISFLTSWGYTIYFFPGETLPNVFFAGICLWVFGMFLLTLTALAAALSKTSSIFCMLAVGAAVTVLNLLNLVPQIEKYNPSTLAQSPMSLIAETVAPGDVYPTLAVAVAGMIALTLLAVMVFYKKRFAEK
jgi:ABC-2 type transport system permease protein